MTKRSTILNFFSESVLKNKILESDQVDRSGEKVDHLRDQHLMKCLKMLIRTFDDAIYSSVSQFQVPVKDKFFKLLSWSKKIVKVSQKYIKNG